MNKIPLVLNIIKIGNDLLIIKILNQLYRNEKFNNVSGYFKSSNGLTLGSWEYPDYSNKGDGFVFLRGENEKRDNHYIIIDGDINKIYKNLKQAVREYNLMFIKDDLNKIKIDHLNTDVKNWVVV